MATPPPARRILSPEALVAVAFWGVSFVATRIALEAFHPVGLIATRLAIGAALLVLVQLARKQRFLPEREDRARGVLLGLVLGVHLLLQAYGLLLTTAIQTAWIIAFIPVMIALGGQLFLGQRLAPAGWLGVVVGTAGVLVVASGRPPDFERAHWGDLLQLVSCVTWTIYTLASHRTAARSGPLRSTAFAMGVAALVTLAAAPTTAILGGAAPADAVLGAPASAPAAWFLVAPPTARALVSVAFLGIFCNGLAFWLWLRALSRDGAARIGAMLYLEPFVTLGAALLLLGEPVTVHALVGGPIVLLGVWLVGKGARG